MSSFGFPTISSREMITALVRAGFEPRKSKKHYQLVHPDSRRRVSVPIGKTELDRGVLLGIRRQTGWTQDEFLAYLKGEKVNDGRS